MRILFLNPTGSLGGAERVLLSLLEAVRPAAEPHLLTLADGPLVSRAARLGVPSTVLPLPQELSRLGDSRLTRGSGARRWMALLLRTLGVLPAAWTFAGRLRRAIRAVAPDLVHSNGLKTHLLARLAGMGRTPIVWHAHDFYSERPVVRHLLRWARSGVVGVLAVSAAVAQDFSATVPGLAVRVVHNTIDADAFSPAATDPSWLDTVAGLPAAGTGVVRVGLVATYARWKGHDLFLEAVARLKQTPSAVPLRYYLVGGPIYQTDGSQFTEEELRALAARLGVADRIGFVGFQPDTAAVYRSLDVAVHASTRPEPFGLTILEAMACGRAVVVARAGGAAELFTHDEDALGFAPGDAAALASAVRDLAGDPDRRRRLGAAARARAVRCFNRSRLSDQLHSTYAELLAPRSRTAAARDVRRPLFSF
jgi:glycosyltransferase involved in cell wall biosynthesis